MTLRRPNRLSALAALIGVFSLAPAAGAATEFTPYIFQGSEVSAPSWEAFVGVSGGGQAGECSGAVIGDRWVLTAAHCVAETGGPAAGSLRAGLTTLIAPGPVDVTPVRVHLTGQAPRPTAPTTAAGEAYAIPENYSPGASQRGDLALIRLDTPVDATFGVPVARADQAPLAARGASATLRGWGVTETGTVSPTPRQATANIAATANCQASAQLPPFRFDAATMLCAGRAAEPRSIACGGDSGGPLTIAAPGGYPLLVGVDSFGAVECGLGLSYFTRASAFADFVSEKITTDPVAAVTAPEIRDATFVRTGPTTGEVRGTINPGGQASAVVATTAGIGATTPADASSLVGSGRAATAFVLPITGLLADNPHAVTLRAENLTAPHDGVTGTISAVPGESTTGTLLPAPIISQPVCGPVPEAAPSSAGTRKVALSAAQLRVNQRIGQAAIRRLNAIDAWLDAGITGGDLCGAALDTTSLSGLELALGEGADRTIPTPRPLKIAKARRGSRTVRLTRTQLRINQRVYQAAVRRAGALRARLGGGLTGGDVLDGSLGVNSLPPGVSARPTGEPPAPLPASRTRVAKAQTKKRAVVRLTAAQVRTNQRIAQAGVREANALVSRIERGLTRKNFAPGSISGADFQPAELSP